MTVRCCCTALLILAAAGFRAAGDPAPKPVPSDNLNLRFADGIVAIVEEKVITVDDVRHEIQPLIAQVQRDARNEEDFNQKLEQLQDQVIQQLIDKVLIIKEFHKHKEGEDEKKIPDSFVDNRVAEVLNERCPRQNRSNHFALGTDAPAMDDPQGSVSQAMGFGQVLLHHSLDILGGNAMQIKHIRDG